MSETSKRVTPWLCNTFCNENCTIFSPQIRSSCKIANSECDCRQFWELPLFWTIFIIIWIVFILAIYCLIQLKKFRCKNQQKVTANPVMIVRPMGQPFQVATKQTRLSVTGAAPHGLPVVKYTPQIAY